MSSPISLTTDRAGWRIREWCRAVGGCRSWYYTLRGEMAPRALTVGRMHVIVEPPGEWLRRVGRDVARRAA